MSADDITAALVVALAEALEAAGMDRPAARASAERYRAHLHSVAAGALALHRDGRWLPHCLAPSAQLDLLGGAP